MNKILNRLLEGTFKKHLILPIITVLISFILFFVMTEHRTMITSAFIGFLVGKSVVDISIVLYHTSEDARKSIKSYDELKRIYDEDTYGHKSILFPKKPCVNFNKETLKNTKTNDLKLFYAPLLTNHKRKNVHFSDNPETFYKLPRMIIPYFADLLSAHKASYTENAITYRLLDAPSEKEDHIEIKTGRTKYYEHLAMNRAIDFPINSSFTVRKLFEFDSILTPISTSVFPNQIGVNAIILFSDNRTLFPKRSLKSTVAKNKLTASLAIRLDAKDRKAPMTRDAMIEDFKDKMKTRLYFTEAETEKPMSVDLLGIGRNLCEGGKPQFYYLIRFDDYTSENYMGRLNEIENQKKKDMKNQIDFDKKIFVADFDSLAYNNAKQKFSFKSYEIGKSGKAIPKTVKGKFEMSFYYNLWHYYDIYEPYRISNKKTSP